jgi:mannan endo-1,6-alpha-mannosidase
MRMRFFTQAAGALAVAQLASGIDLTVTDDSSITSAAKTIVEGLTSYYTGYRPGDTPGYLPAPYYWWECGAMFNTLINYWYYTGDTTYNQWVIQGLQHQASPTDNFMVGTRHLLWSCGNESIG